MNKRNIFIVCGVAILVVLMLFVSESEGKVELNYTTEEISGILVYNIESTKYVETTEETNLVKIDVKDKGIIIAELYPDIAPITVANYKKLVSEKFYDNLIFHRVIKDFMIQTGDPLGTGQGGSDEEIKGEFSENGVENNLEHTRGVLSMARRGADPDTDETRNSASSQFFIVHADYPSLNGKYAAFGKVINGLDVVDKIASVATNENDKPITNVEMTSIRFVKVYEEGE